MNETDRLRAVIEALPVCLVCQFAAATNATKGTMMGVSPYRCDEHRSSASEDLPYADALRAYEFARTDPVMIAIAKAPVGRPFTEKERRAFEQSRAFRAAGGEGVSGEEMLASWARFNSDDPTIAAAERAASDARMADFKKKVSEGRRLLAMGDESLAREVTRLRGVLIEIAKNHPESAEWIMAMFTPLDGSFDGRVPQAPSKPG